VLGLPKQVGGAKIAIDRVVRDQQRFRWTGEEIDAYAPVKLALGLRDESIAGPGQHVDRLDGFGADRHRRDRLNAAEAIDLVGAVERLRGHDLLGGARVKRRGTGGHALAAGDLRRQDGHMSRRQHRILAARHVGADTLHRNVAVAEEDARFGFHLKVKHRLALRLREALNLLPGEGQVLALAVAEAVDARGDLGVGQAVISRSSLSKRTE
jgi:hypothetical protein